MSVRVFYEILNQRGTPAMFTDTLANRPAFGFAGRLFISTDSGQIFEDTGSAWTLVADAGVGGGTLSSVCLNGNTTATGIVITAGGLSTNSLTNTSLTTGSILFADGGGLISQSNSTFFWDNTNKRLGIGTASPSGPLDIHATGTNAYFNGTGSNNAYLQFQNAGVSKWRIGNNYNAGANSFDIYNNSLTANAISINSANLITTSSIFCNTSLTSNGTFTANTNINITNGAGITVGAGYNVIASDSLGFFLVKSNSTNWAYLLLSNLTAPRNFTFPDATGTLALTSNLSSYVPYTGATGSVDLGTNNYKGATLLLKDGASIPTTSGYGVLSFVKASTQSSLYLTSDTGFTSNLQFTNTSSNNYTFPNTSGTIALTSDISGYLPLTGGTLTGQLYINPTNTGVTGLDVASDNISFRSDNLEGNKRQLLITMGSGTLIKFQAQGYGASYGTDLGFYTSSAGGANATPAMYITGGNKIGILNGSPTYTFDVTGNIRSTSNSYFGTDGSSTVFINTTSGGFTNPSLLINAETGLSIPLQVQTSSGGRGCRFYNSDFNNSSTGTSFRIDFGGASGNVYTALRSFYSGESSNGLLTLQQDGGNVLIGTTTDNGSKLQVNGSATINNATGFGALDVGGQTSGSAQNICRLGNITGLNNGLIIQVNSSNNYIYNFGTLGTGSVVATANVLSATSDMNLKVADGYIENALDKVLKIIPRYFYWKEETGMPTNLRQLGFFAQEINECLGEEVANAPKNNNEKWGIYDRGMIAMLTKAIQELNEKLVKNNIN